MPDQTHHYERPAIDAPVFCDSAGVEIDYGNRWGRDGPPSGTYSVTSHMERFAPLHQVADALIAHLVATFDVVVEESTKYAADLLYERDDATRAVRLTPASAVAARMTFVFTSFPSVIVHAGVLQDLLFPDCGCDACDDSWEAQAEELEWQVQAVAAGGLRERMTRRPWARYEMGLRGPDAFIGSSGARLSQYPADRARPAREVLKSVRHGWAPWPIRGVQAEV